MHNAHEKATVSAVNKAIHANKLLLSTCIPSSWPEGGADSLLYFDILVLAQVDFAYTEQQEGHWYLTLVGE